MRGERRSKRAFVVAGAAIAMGIVLFVYGQALGAFIVADCHDFKSPVLSLRCRQPVFYIWLGIGTSAGGVIGVFGLLARGVRRR